MKRIVAISLSIFFPIVVFIFTAGLLFYQNNQVAKNPNANNNIIKNGTAITSGTNVPIPVPAPILAPKLNMAEVAKHNTLHDCYLVISNKVYDVTSYIPMHPGGAGSILPYCGKEATQAFATKGGRGAHSTYAYSLLNPYYIGDLAP